MRAFVVLGFGFVSERAFESEGHLWALGLRCRLKKSRKGLSGEGIPELLWLMVFFIFLFV